MRLTAEMSQLSGARMGSPG